MKRFDSLQITQRPVTLALLHYSDHFYDTALRQYNFKEALHLYLKRHGYTTIVYFSVGNGIHSLEEEMLKSFLSTQNTPRKQPNQTHMPRIGRGTGIINLQANCADSEQNMEERPQISQSNNGFWQDSRPLTRDAQIAQMCFNMLKREKCIIIIEPSYGESEFTPDQTRLLNSLIECLSNERVRENDNHFILLANTNISAGYNLPIGINPSTHGADHTRSQFWNTKYFVDQFITTNTDNNTNGSTTNDSTTYSLKDLDKPYGATWVMPCPTKEDCKNAFQSWRILGEYNGEVEWSQIDDIMLQITHARGRNMDEQPKSTDEWKNIFTGMQCISYTSFDTKFGIMDRKGSEARRQLEELQGIDFIKQQFATFCTKWQNGRNNPNDDIEPHMAFLGPPGTGKTTVARLFAQIIKDLGMLSSGHLIEATIGDFIGEHIGETRPKTKKLCERAIGGVLFIDEAYGFHIEENEGSNGNTFAKEAVEVLIQYMANYRHDLIVIFAGYEEKTEYMLNHANEGLDRRVPNRNRYRFEPYSAEVLYNIVMHHITKKGWSTTNDFNKALKSIIKIEHALEQTRNSNAGYAEQLKDLIIPQDEAQMDAKNATLDMPDIPIEKRRLIDPTLLNKEKIFADMEKLVGQDSLKTALKELYINCAAQMLRTINLPNYYPNLHPTYYVLTGPTGTGKTTFAKVIADILYDLGIRPGNNGKYFTATTGTDILNTRITAARLLEENLGKTLLIDEAYALTKSYVTDLVGEMEKPEFKNKLCIILAGYEADIRDLMAKNQGLSTRFKTKYTLTDYTDEDLTEMLFRKQDDNIRFDEDCRPLAVDYFAQIRQEKVADNNPGNLFGNAREVENLLMILEQARGKRYIAASEEQQHDPDFARLVLPLDFPNYELINAN